MWDTATTSLQTGYKEQCPLPKVEGVDLGGPGHGAKTSVKEAGAQDGDRSF